MFEHFFQTEFNTKEKHGVQQKMNFPILVFRGIYENLIPLKILSFAPKTLSTWKKVEIHKVFMFLSENVKPPPGRFAQSTYFGVYSTHETV